LISVAGSGAVDVIDVTALYWSQVAKVTVVDFVNKLIDEKYTRFGCFVYSPSNGYDGMLLALPSSAAPSSNSKYSVNDLLAVGVAINAVPGSPHVFNVRAVLLTNDTPTIVAIATKKNWQCAVGADAAKIEQPPPPPKPPTS